MTTKHIRFFFFAFFTTLFHILVVSCAITTKGGRANYATAYGFIANSEAAAVYNGKLLAAICKKSTKLVLNGTYYVNNVSSPVIEKGCELTITGGELVFISNKGFILSDNSSFNANNTIFRTVPGVKCYILSPSTATTNIKTISFVGCEFKGNVLTRMHFKPTENRIGGINVLSIVDCFGDSYPEDRDQIMGRFWIENGGYAKGCVIKGNIVKNMVGPFAYLSDRSPLLAHLNTKVVLEGNRFEGADGVSIDSYHCASLVEVSRCLFRNNTIENFINYNTGESATAYDSYLSCNELYYERNTVKNVIAVANQDGKKAYCEWTKSKATRYPERYSCRIIKENRFENNTTELNKKGINGDKSMSVSLFHYSSPFNSLVIENNFFLFPNGNIELPQHSLHMRSIGKIRIVGNIFMAQGFTGSLVYCSSEYGKVDSIDISKNEFYSNDSPIVLTSFSEKKGYGYGNISIVNNQCSTGFIFSGAYSDQLVFKNNVSENDGKSKVAVYYNLTGCKKAEICFEKHYPTRVEKCPDVFLNVGDNCHIIYHIDNIKNIPYIQFRTRENYSLSVGYKQSEEYFMRKLEDRYDTDDKQRRSVKSLDGHQIDISSAKGNGIPNPLQMAKLGIDNSISTDTDLLTRTIQISGRHSTWPELQFDQDYGFDIIFN